MAESMDFNKFFNIINNEPSETERTFQAIDPSTEEKLWDVPVATETDLDLAVAAAKTAFKPWSTLHRDERSKLLIQFADELAAHKDQFIELVYRETGKPRAFAETEVLMGIGTSKIHASWSVLDKVVKDTEDVKIVLQHVPMGVVAGITPWNYPFQLAILKLAAAVMAGCTVIIKPSPFTPYATLKIGEVASRIFPPGVVQVLAGDDALGPWITAHPGISKISFTGSIATGKRVMAAASSTLKRVNLELGGNDAAIVTDDFDVAHAAELVADAAFRHSGQVCMASKRVYVHSSVYDEFMTHLTAIVKEYKPGEGFCSPIQNKMQYDKLKSLYEDCEAQKYDFAVGTGNVSDNAPRPGYFIAPAIIANPPDTSRIVQEEPFGPIVPVLKWEKDSEVIERANDTLTGLGGTVYCRNEDRAWAIAGSLETGSVWVNGGLQVDPAAMFGTHKHSGIGGELGQEGLKYYTNPRSVTYWKNVKKDGPNAGQHHQGFLS